MSIKIQFEKGPAKPKRRVLRFTQEEPKETQRSHTGLILAGVITAFILISLSIGFSNSVNSAKIDALQKQQEHDAWKAKEKHENLLFELYGNDWYKYR